MAPRSHYEFVVIRIAYKPNIDSKYAQFSHNIKDRIPGGRVRRDWFESSLRREARSLSYGSNVRFMELQISTGDPDVFTVDDFHYDEVMLILGEEYTSWMYYERFPTRPPLEGYAVLPISYCSCCLKTQYLKILHHIKLSGSNCIFQMITYFSKYIQHTKSISIQVIQKIASMVKTRHIKRKAISIDEIMLIMREEYISWVAYRPCN